MKLSSAENDLESMTFFYNSKVCRNLVHFNLMHYSYEIAIVLIVFIYQIDVQ